MLTSYAIYTSMFAYKTEFIWYFDADLKHMAAWPRGNGTNIDWPRQSCDISACDLSSERKPEKYGRPMKSAIEYLDHLRNEFRFLECSWNHEYFESLAKSVKPKGLHVNFARDPKYS